MTILRAISQFTVPLVGGAIAFPGALLVATPAVAAPADLFVPLIEDIREQLPPGSALRLPAYLPHTPIDIYPIFQSDSDGFRVNITLAPNCQEPSCTVGAVGVLTELSSWPPTADTTELIVLTPEISAYHLTWGQDDDKSHNILWQQDGQIYGLGALDIAVTVEDLVKMAESMAREQPIRRD